MTYCGNNELSPRLITNGGHQVFGSPSQCFRKGYAAGFNQRITDMQEFLAEWGGGYRPHVVQRLIYKETAAMPPGYQRATLAQSMMRGYAMGSIARAKKEKKNLAQRPQTLERHNDHAS